MSILLKLSSDKTPDFSHTFTVNFALAPVVLHLLQYGVVNLEVVYWKNSKLQLYVTSLGEDDKAIWRMLSSVLT